MTQGPDRWTTVDRLYHAALERAFHERQAFLAEACAGDQEAPAGSRVAARAGHGGRRRLHAGSSGSGRGPGKHRRSIGADRPGWARIRSSRRSAAAGWARSYVGDEDRAARVTRRPTTWFVAACSRRRPNRIGLLADRSEPASQDVSRHIGRRAVVATGELVSDPDGDVGLGSPTRLCLPEERCHSGADRLPSGRRYPCCARATSTRCAPVTMAPEMTVGP